jgi:hypothetical protein
MSSRVRIAVAAIAVLVALGRPLPASAQVDVTTCAQVVPPAQVGTLLATLDCSATTDVGVVLEAGATLNLNGFDVIGNPSAPMGTHGIVCHGRCTVLGPGAVRGFAGDGMFVAEAVRIFDATIRNNALRGVEGDGFVRMMVQGAVFAHNGGESLYTGGGVHVGDTLFDSNGAGISALGVTARDSTFTRNGIGINAVGRARITRCMFSGNGTGVQVYKGLISDSVFQENGTGITLRTVIVHRSTITDNLFDGIDVVSAKVKDSTVTGNGAGCTDPRFPCADIDTREQPKVANTTCERSLAWQTHSPWGVCSLD